MHGARAVSHLKQGQLGAATRQLISAFRVWPLLVIDRGIFIAIRELTNRKQGEPTFPEVWHEWGDP